LSSPEQPTAGNWRQYTLSLFQGEVVPQPENEEWAAAVERLSVPGRINEISEEVYYEFLEVLPPKVMRGTFFAFAEGQEPLRVFLRHHERYLGRLLTQEETDTLCELTGLPKDYGSY
jgi:hypothetical protein